MDLVWTGPEAHVATARDTLVVVRELFENARKSVLIGGYAFDRRGDGGIFGSPQILGPP